MNHLTPFSATVLLSIPLPLAAATPRIGADKIVQAAKEILE